MIGGPRESDLATRERNKAFGKSVSEDTQIERDFVLWIVALGVVALEEKGNQDRLNIIMKE